MSESLFALPPASPPESNPEVAKARARTEAARCISDVADRYRDGAAKASMVGLVDVAHLYWAIVRELDRAVQIALTGEDPGDAGTQPRAADEDLP